jgi:hypothetical protein
MENSSSDSKERGVVDLSVDDEPDTNPSIPEQDDDGLLEVWGAATPIVQPRHRRKRKHNNSYHTGAEDSVDAIDITGNAVATIQTLEEQRCVAYKETLGPLRMVFLSGTDGKALLKSHSFRNTAIDNSSKNTGRVHTTKIRNLHRELVQYAFDLPAMPQGSIFVRADESRIHMLRVLITGT